MAARSGAERAAIALSKADTDPYLVEALERAERDISDVAHGCGRHPLRGSQGAVDVTAEI